MGLSGIEELNARFAIPGQLKFEAGGGGLPRVVVSTPTATCHVYLHGAHVTHYQAAGQQPLIFLSSKTAYESGKPIRGGIPICFPFFGPGTHGNPSLPFHGFARTTNWEMASAKIVGNDVSLTLALNSDDKTRAVWPYEFQARYTVTVGTTLNLAFEVKNTGSSPFQYEEALHTYLQIGDVHQIKVTGLEQTDFLDKTQKMQLVPQGAKAVTITSETDRVYLDTTSTCIIHDPNLRRRISIEKQNSRNTVVWNPWSINGPKMADMGDGEWSRMICVETCNVRDTATTVAPGQSHTMSATISDEAISA